MANSDNKINIGDVWKSIDSIQINIGDTWKNCTEAYINIGDVWKQFWSASTPITGDVGLFEGGFNVSAQAISRIEYITISTTGDGTNFGNLTAARAYAYGSSNGTNNRGVIGGGWTGTGSFVNIIEYITINTTGNSVDFGDLVVARRNTGGTSNGTNDRGLFAGGYNNSSVRVATSDYVTISTTGNATNFGNLTLARLGQGGTSNGTSNRAVIGGGNASAGNSNVIDYYTINTTGTATDFGDLTVARGYLAPMDNGTNNRAVWASGNAGTGVMDYVTINSAGNATTFGTCFSEELVAGTSNKTNERGIIAGGITTNNRIHYITINTTGDSTSFGTMNAGAYGSGGLSNA